MGCEMRPDLMELCMLSIRSSHLLEDLWFVPRAVTHLRRNISGGIVTWNEAFPYRPDRPLAFQKARLTDNFRKMRLRR